MLDVLRFWLDRGVDGFRVDVIWHLIKDDRVPRQPAEPRLSRRRSAEIDRCSQLYTTDRPEVHDSSARCGRCSTSYDDRVLIGEIYLPVERLVAYYGQRSQRRASAVQLPADRSAVERARDRQADRRVRSRAAGRRLAELGARQPRQSAHRDPRRREQARVAAMLLLTLRGTPTLYYGDEIGMDDVPIPPDQVQDPWEWRARHRARARPGAHADAVGWPPNAGFTTTRRGCHWRTIGQSRTLRASTLQPFSILSLYRRLLALRRNYRALRIGRYETLTCRDDVFGFARSSGQEKLIMLLNFSQERRTVSFESDCPNNGSALNGAGPVGRDGRIRIHP